jgi:hypothetical protein
MADETTTLRTCIGSKRFGIEAHDAPIEDFPRQPSQKDGIGRMCREHWNAYTSGLAKDAKARKAAVEEAPAEPESTTPVEPEPARKRATSKSTPGGSSQEDAG